MDYGYGARFETGESVYALIPDAEITPPKPPMHVSKVRRACGRPRSACVREGDGVEGVQRVCAVGVERPARRTRHHTTAGPVLAEGPVGQLQGAGGAQREGQRAG